MSEEMLTLQEMHVVGDVPQKRMMHTMQGREESLGLFFGLFSSYASTMFDVHGHFTN